MNQTPDQNHNPVSPDESQLSVHYSTDVERQFTLAAEEIWRDNINFPDKEVAMAALRDAQAEAVKYQTSVGRPSSPPDPDSAGEALLLIREPDYEHPEDLVMQFTREFLRGHSDRDVQLAKAKANRALDSIRNSKERGELVKKSAPEEAQIPFGEAMMEITGQTRPAFAEKTFIDGLLARGFEAVDYNEEQRATGSSSYLDACERRQYKGSKVPEGYKPNKPGEGERFPNVKVFKPSEIFKPTKGQTVDPRKEIEKALAPFRESGFTRNHVARLREQHHRAAGRSRSKNPKKKEAD